MFKHSRLSAAAIAALAGMWAVSAHAQDAQRVEITGSAIKRVDAETAVPITIIKADDLKKQGVATVEQVMNLLTAVQMTQSTSQVVGSGSGGASFADLRGIGANKTLVLLNGRRVANNAYDSSAPDLNMIPFAAIDRVEVLRDGASSLYGTDAVGGVINFITRKDFTGGVITVGGDRTEAGGGASVQGNVGFGFGDLSKDGFNVFGFVDFNKTDRIDGTERPYNTRQPGGISPTPYPANYYQDGANISNPAGPGCTSPSNLVAAGDGSCYIATASFVNYTPKVERSSAMLRGTLRLGNDHNLSLEWFGTRGESQSVIAPVPYGTLWMNRLKPDGSLNPYYPGNSASAPAAPSWLSSTYTQTNMTPRTGVTLQPGFIVVKWRDLVNGSRTDTTVNKQQRLVAQMDGLFAGWDYQVGLSYNENKIAQNISGYSDGNIITRGMLNGLINPWSLTDAASEAYVRSASLAGNLQNATGKVTALDTKWSRELGDWFKAGRGAAVALGGEFRREDFWSASNTPFAELVQASTGVDPTAVSEGTRNITALYGELSVPINKMLEVTAALRFDKYSDFGSTTNPKFSVRFQPSKELLMRATFSTGFRAPSLYEINSTPYYTNTGNFNDPVNCPGGTPIAGKSRALNCNVQFQGLYGGNTSLRPEKSKNLTLGLIFEPMRDLNVGIDFWWVQLKDAIDNVPEATVLSDPITFASVYKRNAAGDLSIDGFSCPGSDCGYLDLRTQNLGGVKTSGADLSANYRIRLQNSGTLSLGLASTYVNKYIYQDYVGGPWNNRVSEYSGADGPIFRWQHAASATWALGTWTFGLVGHHKTGYKDFDPTNHVSSYTTLDGFVSYAPNKQLTMTFGINNMADRDPPFSWQEEVFQANYDPRFTDPTGRKFYGRLSYRF